MVGFGALCALIACWGCDWVCCAMRASSISRVWRWKFVMVEVKREAVRNKDEHDVLGGRKKIISALDTSWMGHVQRSASLRSKMVSFEIGVTFT